MNRRVRGVPRALAAVALILGAALPGPTASQETLVEEVRVKAAYLHKFPGFVEWPEPTGGPGDGPYVIGVAGSDAVFAELERVARGRLVQGRPVEVRKVGDADRKQVGALHVLFLSRDLGSKSGAFVKATEGLPVLTVAEDAELQRRVALNFVNRGSHVRFEVSLPVVDGAGLTLSSRLLALADRVFGARTDSADRR